MDTTPPTGTTLTLSFELPLHEKTCAYCGVTFMSPQSKARFCCKNHRIYAWVKEHPPQRHRCPDCGRMHITPRPKPPANDGADE